MYDRLESERQSLLADPENHGENPNRSIYGSIYGNDLGNKDPYDVPPESPEKDGRVHEYSVESKGGWIVVLGCAIANFMVVTMSRTFGVFYPVLLQRYGGGASATAAVQSVCNSVRLFGGLFVSTLATRFGCRTLVIIGGLMLCLGFFITAWAPSLTVIFISLGIISGVGGALIFTTTYIAINEHFDKNRGKALGLSTVGVGLGVIALAPLTSFLLEYFGYFYAMVIISGMMLLNVIGGALMRPNKKLIVISTTEVVKETPDEDTPNMTYYVPPNTQVEDKTDQIISRSAPSSCGFSGSGSTNSSSRSPKKKIRSRQLQSEHETSGYFTIEEASNDEKSQTNEEYPAITEESSNEKDRNRVNTDCDYKTLVTTGGENNADEIERNLVKVSKQLASEGTDHTDVNNTQNANVLYNNIASNGNDNIIPNRNEFSSTPGTPKRRDITFRTNSLRLPAEIASRRNSNVVQETANNEPIQIVNGHKLRRTRSRQRSYLNYEESDLWPMSLTFSRNRFQSSTKTKSVLCSIVKDKVTLFKNIAFVMYCIKLIILPFVINAALFFIPAIAEEAEISAFYSSLLLSVNGLFDVLGRFTFGFIFDLSFIRPRRRAFHSFLGIILGGCCILFGFANDVYTLAVASALHGFFEGGFHAQRTAVLSEFLLTKQVNDAIGFTMFSEGIGNLIASPLLGEIRDIFDTYKVGFIASGAAFSAWCIVFLIQQLIAKFCCRTSDRQ